MAYKEVRDIINQARLFHSHVSKLYCDLEFEPEKVRVKMLLEFMCRHERHLEKCLEKYEDDVSKSILETWIQYVPYNASSKCIDDVQIKPDMSVGNIITLALQLDDCLLNLYKDIKENTISDAVREFFTNLLEMEKQEEIELIRNALELKKI